MMNDQGTCRRVMEGVNPLSSLLPEKTHREPPSQEARPEGFERCLRRETRREHGEGERVRDYRRDQEPGRMDGAGGDAGEKNPQPAAAREGKVQQGSARPGGSSQGGERLQGGGAADSAPLGGGAAKPSLAAEAGGEVARAGQTPGGCEVVGDLACSVTGEGEGLGQATASVQEVLKVLLRTQAETRGGGGAAGGMPEPLPKVPPGEAAPPPEAETPWSWLSFGAGVATMGQAPEQAPLSLRPGSQGTGSWLLVPAPRGASALKGGGGDGGAHLTLHWQPQPGLPEDRGALPAQALPAARSVVLPDASTLRSGVARAIGWSLESGLREMVVQLRPPELGRLEISLRQTEEGRWRTHVRTEQEGLRDLLASGTEQIRGVLNELGMAVEAVEVSLAGPQDWTLGSREGAVGDQPGKEGDPSAGGSEKAPSDRAVLMGDAVLMERAPEAWWEQGLGVRLNLMV